jgi:hypothetical protein
MSIQAKTLCAAGASAHLIRELVRDQRVVIDSKLAAAPKKWGRNVVAHDLPMTFSIPGLGRLDAQRLVYSALVLDLDERGFGTMICPTSDRATLYISFNIDFGIGEVDAMDALLAARTLPPDRIGEWIDGKLPSAALARSAAQSASSFTDTAATSTPQQAPCPDGLCPLDHAQRGAPTAARIANMQAEGGLRAPSGVGRTETTKFVYKDDRVMTPRNGLVKNSHHRRHGGDDDDDARSTHSARSSRSARSDRSALADAFHPPGGVAGETDVPLPGPGWPRKK